jgi:hypothetical protein
MLLDQRNRILTEFARNTLVQCADIRKLDNRA